MREACSEKGDWGRDPLLRSIIGVAALLTIVTLTMLFYRGSGPTSAEIPWFLPLANAFLLVAALCVAFLAISRFYVLRCPVSYWLGVASVALGVGIVFYVLTWPGLVQGGRAIIGGLPSTSGWMLAIAQILLALFLIAAAVSRRPGKRTSAGLLYWSLAGWALCAFSIHLFFLLFASRMPVLVKPGGDFTPLFLVLRWIAFVLFAAGILFSIRRYVISGNALCAYIAICQLACACAALILIIGAKRYGIEWYTARILNTSSYLVIMFGLLSEYVGLFRREEEKSLALDQTLMELRESRDRLVLAQQAGRVGIFDWNMKTNRLIWSPQLEELFGLAPGGFEGTYEAWTKRLYPDDRARIESQFRQWTSEQRTQVEFVHRIVRADNAEVRWMSVRARIGYLPKGTAARMIGTELDVTEQKRAENALKRSEALMTQAGEMASLGAWEITFTDYGDVDKNPLHWSDEVYRIFGHRPGSVEVTNELFWKHVHPDDRQRVRSAVEKALKEKRPYEIEHRIVRPDGSERIVVEHADIRFDGEGRPLEMAGAVQDITGRKRAEQALRDAEDRLRLATEATHLGAFDYSPQTGALIWSAYTKLHFGLPPDAHVDYDIFLKGIHPEDRPRVEQIVQDALRSESKGEYAAQYRTIGIEDGKERWIEARGRALFDERGKPVRFIGTTLDITGRKKSEEALQRVNAQLEIRVRERTAELERRNKELQDFAFIASHDLKEPLRKIRAFGDLVAARSRDALSRESAGYLARMQSAAARMQVLLESLLDYSRVTTKGKSFEDVDLRLAVQEAISNLEMRIRETNASIEVGIPPSAVEADDIQLVQLFQNLLGNALKFHKEGVEPRINIYSRLLEKGAGVQVYIEDEGIGFDEKYLEKIFEPFQRLHGRDEGYEGVGMGLAICKKIVERHKGAITAKSTPGMGTTFIVTLPVRMEQGDRVIAAQPPDGGEL